MKPSASIGTKPGPHARRTDAPAAFREADALLAQLREGLERASRLVTEASRSLHPTADDQGKPRSLGRDIARHQTSAQPL
jgi:hypothetical protein